MSNSTPPQAILQSIVLGNAAVGPGGAREPLLRRRSLVNRALAFCLLLCVFTGRLAADWPQFRGPDGQGHSDQEGVPTQWSEQKNVAWKTAVPGQGWSSPVVAGNQVWMTSAKDEGKSLHAICFDKTSGQLLHDVEVLQTDDPGPRHKTNGYASPTPVLDGKHVYVHFGTHGTVCLDTAGKIIWKNTDFKYLAFQGAASSPILHDDLLILTYDGFSIVCRPSYGNGLFYVVGSISQDHFCVYAVRPGEGKLRDDQIVWQRSKGIAHVPSPLLVGKELFVIDNGGVAACVDALTGKEHWRQRLGGNYDASPIEVRGRIYFCSRDGKTTVLSAGKEFATLATNQLNGTFKASPAVADGALFLRSDTHLFRIEEQEPSG